MKLKSIFSAFIFTAVMSPAMAQVQVKSEELSISDDTGRTYTYSVLMECRSNICAGLVKFIDSKPDLIPAEIFCASQIMFEAVEKIMAENDVLDYEKKFACGAA